jgi:DNA-binding MurR/RpiR family transcriptional regulator
MGFRAALEQKQVELTPSEERIVRLLLANPRECLLLSAAELAERASAHESTAIRFAKKLGYEGYPELRADLLDDVQEPNGSWGKNLFKTAEQYQLHALVSEQVEILSQLPHHIAQDCIDEAAHALINAHRIFIYGRGFAMPLVDNIERKLRFLGFEVVPMRHGGSDLAEHFVAFSKKDVLLGFAFENKSTDISPLLQQVHKAGATSILISDHSGMLLRPAPTILLAAPRGPGAKRKLLVPSLLSYALEYAVIHFAPNRVKETLKRLDELRIIFDEERETK